MNLFLGIDWNFNPDLFKLGSFPIKYYSLMYVLAFVVGLQLMKQIYKKDNVSLDKLDPLFIYTIVAMLIGARTGHYLFYEEDYTLAEMLLPFKLNPFEWTGFMGLASHGAIIGIIIAMIIYSKRIIKKPLLWVLDRIAVVAGPGCAFVRFGNLFNSEIVGKPTDSSLGFRFIRNTGDLRPYDALKATGKKSLNEAYNLIATKSQYKDILESIPYRHPSQIYEALGYLITFGVLWYLYWKTDKKEKLGYLFGVFMVLFWSVRFLVEFLKEWQGGLEEWIDLGIKLNTGQWLSIPLILIGLFFMFRPTKKVA